MHSAFNESVFQKVVLAINRTTRGRATQVSLSTRLADDLALSRRGRLMLAIHLEDIFDIELPNDVSNGFVSIADIVAYSSSRYFQDAATCVAATSPASVGMPAAS